MEPFYINYSTKNIPIPSKLQNQRRMIEKRESFMRRMRWKLFAVLNPGMVYKKTFGFNTTISPPQLKELELFESDFFALIRNIKFRPIHSKFQSMLKKDVQRIHESEDVIVSADKTRNMFKIPVKQYNKLVKDNITSVYKKCEEKEVSATNEKAALIANKLEIDDRVDQFIHSDAYVTVKDHKPDFPSRIQCRLINPASNIGKISKQMLEEIVRNIKQLQDLNQWTNSTQVKRWFQSLQNKKSLSFLKFDIVAFYPSITKRLFLDSINWARSIYKIPEDVFNVILHSRESFLFQNGETWTKKGRENFDVTMGAYDGAELCELVGLYILSKLEKLIGKNQLGIYRDDGLAAVSLSGPGIEKLRKEMFKFFKKLGLGVTIDGNITQTDFLDLWLDLKNNSFKAYRKPNDTPVYIDINSNHPPNIKKELPRMICSRLSNLSSSKEMFEIESPPYEEALKNAGYKEKLVYTEEKEKESKRKRHRKVIWFNPPYSANVQTNVAAKFLSIIDKHFKNTDLGKYFNRSNVKVSYSCMGNMESIIAGHNRKIIRKEAAKSTTSEKKKECNCRVGESRCPLKGKCLTQSIIYKAKISTNDETSVYIGQTSNTFKERFLNHTKSFNLKKYETSTSLSKYIWKLKSEDKPFNIDWSIEASAPAYNPASKNCRLCTMEKTIILFREEKNPLNKRSELLGKCRHRAKYLLSATIKQPNQKILTGQG